MCFSLWFCLISWCLRVLWVFVFDVFIVVSCVVRFVIVVCVVGLLVLMGCVCNLVSLVCRLVRVFCSLSFVVFGFLGIGVGVGVGFGSGVVGNLLKFDFVFWNFLVVVVGKLGLGFGCSNI